MLSITPVMSVIWRELALISCMVSTTCSTIWPPRLATSVAPVASWLAVRALSALWRTVALSSSMADAVSCRALACSSVRRLRSALPVAISLDPVEIESEASRTSVTMWASVECMLASEASTLPGTTAPWRCMGERSPLATCSAICRSSAGSPPSAPVSRRVMTRPATVAMMNASTAAAISAVRSAPSRSSASSASSWARLRDSCAYSEVTAANWSSSGRHSRFSFVMAASRSPRAARSMIPRATGA